MTVHPRIEELMAHLDRARTDLRAAVDSVPADRRQERPGADRWSVAEVLEHLSLVEARIAAMLARAIEAAKAAGVAAETSRTSVLTQLDAARVANRGQRFTAAENAAPTGRIDADAAWIRLGETRAALEAALRSGDGLALETITEPHRRLGPLNVYQWVIFAGGHESRHAEQIREIAGALR